MKKTTRAKLVRFGFEGSDRQAADEDWREAMEASTVALAKIGSFRSSTRSVARVAPLPPGASDASNPTPARARSRPALRRRWHGAGCLRKLRSQRGLSQEKLADLAGVSRAAIARLESGRTLVVTTQFALALASVLGVTRLSVAAMKLGIIDKSASSAVKASRRE
jgi:DNA-binding XRE family transcriptional regulator